MRIWTVEFADQLILYNSLTLSLSLSLSHSLSIYLSISLFRFLSWVEVYSKSNRGYSLPKRRLPSSIEAMETLRTRSGFEESWSKKSHIHWTYDVDHSKFWEWLLRPVTIFSRIDGFRRVCLLPLEFSRILISQTWILIFFFNTVFHEREQNFKAFMSGPVARFVFIAKIWWWKWF